jgi:uncharacterized protein YndB with AHSA1/START domain
MAPGSDAPAAVAEREIVIARTFAAPRELVFRAWTDPELVRRWWGPRGFTTTTHEMDVRPGGIWRFVMHGPDGTDYDNRIVYREVVEPERLAYSHDSGEDDDPYRFQVTVTFVERAGKTELTMRSLFGSAAARDYVVKEFGAIEGGLQTLDRLAEHLASGAPELFITRIFNAPRRLVFKAWTDPDIVKQWLGPTGFTATEFEMDRTPGGAWHSRMRSPEGVQYANRGLVREAVEPERLVFTFAWDNEDGSPGREMLITITLADHDDGTEMTFHQAELESAEDRDGHRDGWSQSFDRLADYLAAA